MGHGPAEDEAPRLDSRHLVDAPAREGVDELVHGAPEGPRIAEQRRDVPEDDARLRIIRDGADGRFEVGGEALVHVTRSLFLESSNEGLRCPIFRTAS